MATEELCQRFISGLVEYDLTLEDMKRFRYAGMCWRKQGCLIINKYFYDSGFTDDDLPNYATMCICHTKIKRNCYITDGKRVLVIGNCCKNKFLPLKNRFKTCERCGESHKNRKDNRCKKCRELCDCGTKVYKYGKCYTCYYGKPCENCKKMHLNKYVNRCDECRDGICDNCGKKCKPPYKICYTCHMKKKERYAVANQ